jgi:hypothetical protein
MMLEYNPAFKTPKNLQHLTNRHGKKVWYYVPPGTKRRHIIKGEYGSRAFMDQIRTLQSPDVAARMEETERILCLRVKNARSRDRAKGRIPEITQEWAVAQLRRQQYRCRLTNIEFLCKDALSKNNPYSPSIDRIDNSKGYTLENVRIVLFAVNAMLLDWGEDVLNHVTDEYYSRIPRLAPDFLVRAPISNNKMNSGG